MPKPDYDTTGDWTRGYRDAWYYFRSGCAWQLLIWVLHVMPEDDPSRLKIALALTPIAESAQTEKRGNTQRKCDFTPDGASRSIDG